MKQVARSPECAVTDVVRALGERRCPGIPVRSFGSVQGTELSVLTLTDVLSWLEASPPSGEDAACTG